MLERPTITYGEGLPPQQFVSLDLGNPREYYQSIETPVDERGLILVDELVTVVKDLVSPGYEWPTRLSVHHFYDPARWYPNLSKQGEFYNPAVFRNLPIHKGLVPRQFENLLHWATRPVDVPDAEVMRYRVEAWKVAQELFKMVRGNVVWQRRAARREMLLYNDSSILREDFDGRDIEGEDIMEDIFDRNFRGIERQKQRGSEIPPEFHLVQLDSSPRELATNLGKLVVPRSLHLVRRVAA